MEVVVDTNLVVLNSLPPHFAASTTTPAPPASVPPASTAPTNSGPNPYQREDKTIYTRAIRALPGPVLHTANIYFQHNANGNPNVTSPFQLSMTSAATASLSTLLPQLSPVNLCAHLASAPAVTTTVLGACKRTRSKGCSFHNTLPLQG